MLITDNTANISKNIKIVGKGKIIIGSFVSIEDNVVLDTGNNENSRIILGNRVKLKQGSIIKAYSNSIKIGYRTTISEYCCLSGHGGILIGNNVIIASHTTIHASSHIYINTNISIRFQGEQAKGIIIDNGAWIGTHVSILDNVKIGKNTIIGAGSVVTHNMPNNSICYGVPCKFIKKRS